MHASEMTPGLLLRTDQVGRGGAAGCQEGVSLLSEAFLVNP